MRLSEEEVAFECGLGRPIGVEECACLLYVGFDLGEASAVCALRPVVEHLASIAEGGAGDDARRVVCGWVGRVFGGDEIEHVEFAARVREEPREVAHALEVSYMQGTTLVCEGPVVALASRDADACGRLPGRWRDFDSIEEGTRRLQLQRGLPLSTVGCEGLGKALACDRDLIGGADFVPQSHGFGQGPLRGRRIALGQAYASVGEGGACGECLAVESVGDKLQLVGGCAGSIDVAGGDFDLDLRLEQRRSLQLGVRRSFL